LTWPLKRRRAIDGRLAQVWGKWVARNLARYLVVAGAPLLLCVVRCVATWDHWCWPERALAVVFWPMALTGGALCVWYHEAVGNAHHHGVEQLRNREGLSDFCEFPEEDATEGLASDA
jgi:protein-S-isoprenylcysteine O-methyltransferase Ste14